jgi:Uma2 family endonuclease
VDIPPDWVCEIVSPGHEKKDTLTIPLLLRRYRVPYYWLIWPEKETLVAHVLDGNEWRVAATLRGQDRGRLPPFEAVELDLSAILAVE